MCRRWRTILIGSHAARVWQKLCVDETAIDSGGASIYYGSLIHWCHVRGRHIRELKILLAKGRAHVRRSFGLRCMSMLVGWCMLANVWTKIVSIAWLHANSLQDELEDSSSRLLTDVCAVLLASCSV